MPTARRTGDPANILDSYQDFVLAEPDSAVRQELKIALLALRRTYESSYSSGETDDPA